MTAPTSASKHATIPPLVLHAVPSRNQQCLRVGMAVTQFAVHAALGVKEFADSYERRSLETLEADNQTAMAQHCEQLRLTLCASDATPSQRELARKNLVQAERHWRNVCGDRQLPAAFHTAVDAVPDYTQFAESCSAARGVPPAGTAGTLALGRLQGALDAASAALPLPSIQPRPSDAASRHKQAKNLAIAADRLRLQEVPEQSAQASVASHRRRRQASVTAPSSFDAAYSTFISTYRQIAAVSLERPAAQQVPVYVEGNIFDHTAARASLALAERGRQIAPALQPILDRLQGLEATLQCLAHDLAYFMPDADMQLRLNIRRDIDGHPCRNIFDSLYTVAWQPLADGAVYSLTPSDPSRASLLLFRGTSPGHGTGIVSDVESDGIGKSLFADAVAFVDAFVARQMEACARKNPDKDAHFCVLGHSLGGALAQRCFTHLPEQVQRRSRLYAFSPAGIDRPTAQAFKGAAELALFWHEDDIVHHAGGTLLPGRVYEFSGATPAPLLVAHTAPLLVQHDCGMAEQLQVRRLSSAAGGTANNRALNLAERVRSCAGMGFTALVGYGIDRCTQRAPRVS